MRIAVVPWKTDPDVGHEAVLSADGAMVADCAILVRGRTSQVNQAHARLCAAAPDLLAVAYLMREYGIGLIKPEDMVHCEAAIAKAELPTQ